MTGDFEAIRGGPLKLFLGLSGLTDQNNKYGFSHPKKSRSTRFLGWCTRVNLNARHFPFEMFVGDFSVRVASSVLAESGAGPASPLMISVALTFFP